MHGESRISRLLYYAVLPKVENFQGLFLGKLNLSIKSCKYDDGPSLYCLNWYTKEGNNDYKN